MEDNTQGDWYLESCWLVQSNIPSLVVITSVVALPKSEILFCLLSGDGTSRNRSGE